MNIMQALMQAAEASKRRLKSAPGHLSDKLRNFSSDFKSMALKAAVDSASAVDPEKLKQAITDVAGNAIPGGGVAAGIFGGAGRQDLFAVRGTSVASLLRSIFRAVQHPTVPSHALGAGKGARGTVAAATPQLAHPSFGIVRDDPRVIDFAEDAIILANPNFLDPANNLRSQLFNRDIYSYRSGEAATTSGVGRLTRRKSRLDSDKSVLTYPLLSEKGSEYMPLAHAMQILSSPKFTSFAEFEASKSGARLLDLDKSLASESKYNIRDSLRKAFEREFNAARSRKDIPPYNSSDYSSAAADFMSYLKTSDSKLAKRLLDVASKTPSSYAELKYTGNFPINPETTQAVLLQGARPAEARTISNALRGVPVINSGDALIATEDLLDFILTAQEAPQTSRRVRQLFYPTSASSKIK